MRLTEKTKNGFYELKKGQEIYGEENGIRLVQIIGQLEDFEEELGIDLLTLFKALKNGIYVKQGNRIKRTHWCISLNANGMYGERETHYWFAYRVNGFDFPDTYEKLKLSDYGKTWALTGEELL